VRIDPSQFGYRCRRDAISGVEAVVMTLEGETTAPIADNTDNAVASRCLCLGTALARFVNCGGTSQEIATILEAFKSLPNFYVPTGTYLGSSAPDIGHTHYYRDDNGDVIAVTEDFNTRKVSQLEACEAIRDGVHDRYDVFLGLL